MEYTLVGDYYLPDLAPPNDEECRYGKYGIIRKNYLRQHQRAVYDSLLLTGKLNAHLNEVDKLTRRAVEELVSALAGLSGVNEDLKARDQMAWCGQMNAIKHQAEEIAMKDYIYN